MQPTSTKVERWTIPDSCSRGYVATIELWEEFQREWNALAVDTVLHINDMLSLRGDFTTDKGCDEIRVEKHNSTSRGNY